MLQNKRTIKHIILRCRPLLRAILSIWYKKEYLKGRYFDVHVTGWRWAVEGLLYQKILRINSHVPWPVSPFSRVSYPASNIVFDVDDLHIFQTFGCYFQCFSASITLGRGTYVAPNVGLITANHNLTDLHSHYIGQPITLGERCWIGMNSVILPGVILGPATIVAAGAVVTQSYPRGYCVLAGVPARVVKTLQSDDQEIEQQ